MATHSSPHDPVAAVPRSLGRSLADAPSNLLDRLEPGERLLWWDRPAAWRFACQRLTYLPVAAVVACVGLWVIINLLVLSRRPDWLPDTDWGTILLGTLAGLIGTYHGVRNILNSRNVAYGLTERRLLIATGRWKAASVEAKAFRKIRRFGERRGTIWVDFEPIGEDGGSRHALFGIADAPAVEELLREQFNIPKTQKSFWRPFG